MRIRLTPRMLGLVCVALGAPAVSLAQEAPPGGNPPPPQPAPAGSGRDQLVPLEKLEPPKGSLEPDRSGRKPNIPEGSFRIVSDGDGAAPAPASPRGGYRGVAPGNKVAPPHAPRKRNPAKVTWTGFQLRSDSARVFVQLTAAVPYQVSESASGLLVNLPGTRLNLRNNGRALNTEFFETAVKGVRVSERRGNVTVEIATKGKPAHTEKIEAEGGYQFLMIDFPGGSDSASSITNNQ